MDDEHRVKWLFQKTVLNCWHRSPSFAERTTREIRSNRMNSHRNPLTLGLTLEIALTPHRGVSYPFPQPNTAAD